MSITGHALRNRLKWWEKKHCRALRRFCPPKTNGMNYLWDSQAEILSWNDYGAKMHQAHVNSKKWRTASAVVSLVGCLCCFKAGYFIPPFFSAEIPPLTHHPPERWYNPGTPPTGARAGASVVGHPRVWCLQHQALMARGEWTPPWNLKDFLSVVHPMKNVMKVHKSHLNVTRWETNKIILTMFSTNKYRKKMRINCSGAQFWPNPFNHWNSRCLGYIMLWPCLYWWARHRTWKRKIIFQHCLAFKV